jgi:membrane fusion protein (multidrug efflux system)
MFNSSKESTLHAEASRNSNAQESVITMPPQVQAAEHEPAHPHQPRPSVRKEQQGSLGKRARALLSAAAGTLLVTAWGFWMAGWIKPGCEVTDDAYVDGHIVSVAPQVAGRVMEVLVDDNQRVEADQVLARIDPAEYQVKLDQALAAQALAEGQFNQATAQLPVTQAMAAQARAQVKVAEANAEKATGDLVRYRQLSGNAISKITLDSADTQHTATMAQVDAARQSAEAATAQIELSRAAIATAQANLKAAAAQVAQARLNLSYCEIRAALPGYVTRKGVERGNYISVGQPVMSLVPQRVYLTANFKETQLAHIRTGLPVTFTVDAYPGMIWHGHVDSVMNGTGSAFALLPPENATGNFVKVVQRVPVKILLDDENNDALHRLTPGMSVVPEVRFTDASNTTLQSLAQANVR